MVDYVVYKYLLVPSDINIFLIRDRFSILILILILITLYCCRMASNEGSTSNPQGPQEQQQPSVQSPRSHNSATKIQTGKSGKSGKLSQLSTRSENRRPSGQAYETPEGQPTAIAEEDREKENALGNEPGFSLANPDTKSRPTYQSHGFYEDPEYRDYNPRYERDNNVPLWSLAQPLPRVIRPGMRLGKTKNGQKDIIATETVSCPRDSQDVKRGERLS